MRNRYDVIHSHEEAAFFCMILAAAFRTRHVYDMHSSLPQQLEDSVYGRYPFAVKLFEILERHVTKTCDAVITISDTLKEHVKELDPTAKVVVVENLAVQSMCPESDRSSAEDLRRRLALNGRLNVIYTGTLEHYQGIELLTESMALVTKHCPAAVLLLVGGRPTQIAYWRSEVERRRLGDSVRVVGAVSVEEIPAYLELADILVSARTRGTSVPLKVYSYLLSGKPIVATDVPAHRELLNEDVAVLTDATKEAFAQAITRLAGDPALRDLLGSRARRLAESEHSYTEYLAKMGQVVQMLQPAIGVTEQVGPPSKEPAN
jgi:glycosyltransferase involved in cell wall biosynthesis